MRTTITFRPLGKDGKLEENFQKINGGHGIFQMKIDGPALPSVNAMSKYVAGGLYGAVGAKGELQIIYDHPEPQREMESAQSQPKCTEDSLGHYSSLGSQVPSGKKRSIVVTIQDP